VPNFKSLILVAVLAGLVPIAHADNKWWEDKDFQDKYCDVVARPAAIAADAALNLGITEEAYAERLATLGADANQSLFAGAYRIRSVFSGAGDKIPSTENALRSGCIERQRQNAPRAETLPASTRNPACPLYLQQQAIAGALKYGIAVVEALGQTSGMAEHTALGAMQSRADRNRASCQAAPADPKGRVFR
jgi:hypothetical protein